MLSLRYTCTMRIYNVRASSSPLGYLCAKFCFVATTAELAHGEKSHTHSLNHLPSLSDMLETEAFTSE